MATPLIPIMDNIDSSVHEAINNKHKWFTVKVGGNGAEGSALTVDRVSSPTTESFSDMTASLPQDEGTPCL